MSMNKKDTTKIREEAAKTLRLGLPLMAAQLVQMSMGVVDTIMAGHFDASALAAVAVGTSMYMPLIVFCSGVLMVVNPIVAQYRGADDKGSVARTLWQVLWLCAFLGTVGVFVLRNIDFVPHLFNISPEVIPITTGYLRAISCGFPFVMGYIALRYFNEGLYIGKPSMYVAIVGSLVNVLGNYVFMYGHLGFPPMGAVGTGWATALVQCVMFACMCGFTLRKSMRRMYDLGQAVSGPKWLALKDILRIGLPNGTSIGLEVSMFAASALIIGSMGTNQVAAHQITINIAALTFMVPLGLSFAISARVGFAVGRKEPENARFIGFQGVLMAACFMGFAALAIFLLPEFIVSFFTRDPEVSRIAIHLLFFAAIFQISDGLQVAGLGALRGLKDTRIPLAVNIVAYWLVGLPSAYYLAIVRGLGPSGPWIGMILGLSIAALLHNLRFHFLTRRRFTNLDRHPARSDRWIPAG